MILKIKQPESANNGEPVWVFIDHIKSLTTEEMTRDYAYEQNFDSYFLGADKEPLKVKSLSIHMEDDNWKWVCVEFGYAYVMNDDGKTIERL